MLRTFINKLIFVIFVIFVRCVRYVGQGRNLHIFVAKSVRNVLMARCKSTYRRRCTNCRNRVCFVRMVHIVRLVRQNQNVQF